ncbi:MAG: amidophosphoribosyltransferase [Lachnospiraceae bacterium]|nr:amidophosphoribosyltransferase [Lachnospiraceae bacterium]
MSIHEECGVFGAFSKSPANLAGMAYYGLFALQHRGQESAGIVLNKDGVFTSYKDMGLVSEVFTEDVLKTFPTGNIVVGHVRYATTGNPTRNNCQPFAVNHLKGKMALAHNGNLSNALDLREQLENTGAIFSSTSDTETIAYMITRKRLETGSIEEAVKEAIPSFEGAFSLVIMSATKLIAVRDPRGFRPLCYGVTVDGTYVVASESCALTAVGAEFIRDIKPGEILTITKDGVSSDETYCGKKEKRTCIFEYIYFAIPDSEIDGISVHAARIKAGEILAKRHPVNADVVIGVPDSGLDAALGYAKELNIPYEIGLIKNKYIGRTFIAPGQEHRFDQVKIKLSPVKSVINGKSVVLIDDSIVRGTTSKRIVKLLREAGAKEIHIRISAPPFLHPCYYGTDIDSEENLIANHLSVNEIARLLGADSLGYLPTEDLYRLVGEENIFCSACFDGFYPTRVPADMTKDRFENSITL